MHPVRSARPLKCGVYGTCRASHHKKIQMVIRRNPERPTFDGLDLVMAVRVDETAGAVLLEFNTWPAAEQSKEGKRMRANRLWREETVAKQSDFQRGERAETPYRPEPKPKPTPKPKPVPKAAVKPEDAPG